MNRQGSLNSVSRITYPVSRQKGFTIIELLVGILISLLILGAISIAFIGVNRGFQKNRPISQAIQEAQSSVAALDFLLSRLGVGVPVFNPKNPIYVMNSDGSIKKDQYGNPVLWQSVDLPNGIVFPPPYPFWYLALDTNHDGKNDTLYFFASIGGSGSVVSCSNASSCNVLSCRLTSSNTDKCYFIFSANGISVKYYELGNNDIANDDIDCLNLQDNQSYNTAVNIVGLSPGDRFQRVPHLIRIYETPIDSKTSWLTFDRIDLAVDCNDNENATYIGRIKRGSLLITPISQSALKIQADFVDENGDITYKFSKVYAK
jgi:prepilin-type N-terminal cleavage/methylation domain-containing protein